MMSVDDADTDGLLRRAEGGDRTALDRLLSRHRRRLRQMVAVRMDRRLAARVDASDVVQEALAEATARLAEYLRRRPAPFYLWLRQLAFERLVDLTRRHIDAQRRSVDKEAARTIPLPDHSAVELADRLMASGTSPSGRMEKEEVRSRVRAALARLPPADREVLVLRHLEQLSTREVAAVLDLSEPAVRYRQRRALERLGNLLGGTSAKEQEV